MKSNSCKLFLVILILIFTYCNVNAQSWAPVGAKWYYNHYSGAPQYLTVIESIGDTLINSKQCRILKTYEIDDGMDSTGAHHWDTLFCPLKYTYLDSGKVYLFDNSKNVFNILYNFNATTGDTITVHDSLFAGYCPDPLNGSLFQYSIDSTDEISINSILLKKQYISQTENSDWLFTSPMPSAPTGNYPIIERIGSIKFLFGVSYFLVMEGPIKCLRCYQDSNIYFRMTSPNDTLPCGYLYPYSIYEKEWLKNRVNIYPNPTTGTFKINSAKNISQIKIFNTLGKLEYETYPNSNNASLNLSLADGIYFIHIISKEGIAVRKIVVQR